MHNENYGFWFEELETLPFWKTIVLEDVDMLDSCALHLSTEKEHFPEDEQISVFSVFERTQQCVPMKDFLPTRF